MIGLGRAGITMRRRSGRYRPLAAAVLRRIMRRGLRTGLRRLGLRPFGETRLRVRGAIAMRSVAEREMQPAALIAVGGRLRHRPIRRLRIALARRRCARRERVRWRSVALARDRTAEPVAVTRPKLESPIVGLRSLRCGRVRVNRRCFRRPIAYTVRAVPGGGFDQLRFACRSGPRRLATRLTRPAAADNIADRRW